MPFGKLTLNYWTVRQKPEDYTQDIKDLIKRLKIVELYEKTKDLDKKELKEYFKYQTYVEGDKSEIFLG